MRPCYCDSIVCGVLVVKRVLICGSIILFKKPVVEMLILLKV